MADPNEPPHPGLVPPSPELVPITRAEYPNYYFPYYGRYFPRYRLPPDLQNAPDAPQLPSVLPIDRHDMMRRTMQHNLVHLCLGSHYFGPFRQHLNPPDGKLVVDIGSDNGRWIEDVSDEFPHSIRFHGVEIFPSSPTEAANNHVRFEVYDFQRDGIRNADASVDIIHARFQNFHIQGWDDFLRDVAKHLKPGGLFMSGELDIFLEYPDGPAMDVYATNQVYNQVRRLMSERGYNPNIGREMEGKLRRISDSAGNPLFTNIGSCVYTIPVGADPDNPSQVISEISALSMDCLLKLAESVRPFLLSQGQARIEVDGLLETHRAQLRTIRAHMSYRCAWAERRA
ncbi:unnamed protein product [Rhizoctonia solani]|uniref:Methyltransferase domain-containing protein n=1 Tax=Rhizoctonia solani TaxID=456999 RepID=A0A8H2WC24_9AGAM|nr:unnamed protein product [Rhizoctonia solani]